LGTADIANENYTKPIGHNSPKHFNSFKTSVKNSLYFIYKNKKKLIFLNRQVHVNNILRNVLSAYE
jgi:hypothetical protein